MFLSHQFLCITIHHLIEIQGSKCMMQMTFVIHAAEGTESTPRVDAPRKPISHFAILYYSSSQVSSYIGWVNWIFKTYLSILAISLTASTPPGSGSNSMKKSLDSQMLMAFSWNRKKQQQPTHRLVSVYIDKMNVYPCKCALRKVQKATFYKHT